MVKITLLAASVATLVFSVSAQIPDGLESIVQSIMSNPAGFKSEIASLSAQITNLPTQYQSAANSALAAASKTLDSIGPKQTAVAASAGTANKPVGYMAAAAAAAAIAAGVMA